MQRALAPEISTWPQEPSRLLGSQCTHCQATAFPSQPRCPKCSASQTVQVYLPRRGTLISWTTRGFAPGPPNQGPVGPEFAPFGFGLVQLGEVIRVEGRLTENDPVKLDCGMTVELTMTRLCTDTAGNDIMAFAFRPV